MSLVVALVDGGRIHINADLRVTQSDFFPEGERRQTPHLFNGTLKIIPVRDVAICYAGAVPTAINLIRTVAKSGIPSKDIPASLISGLEQVGDIGACDFLVVDATQQVIHKVHDGEIDTLTTGSTWIGDIEAFEVFQQKLHEQQYDAADNPISKSAKMMNSLQGVIDDRRIKSVGEFPISAFNNNGKIQLSVGFSAQGSQMPLEQGLHPIAFSADTNQDSLIINLTSPVESGVAAVGIYITQAKRGALYIPLVQDEPILIDAGSIGEFRAKVLVSHGVELMGGGFE